MWRTCFLLVLWGLCEVSDALQCYSCGATQRSTTPCGGDFVPGHRAFNETRRALVNCTTDGALCFVRALSLRARPAWLVQRGCYSPPPGDLLVRSLARPKRAMACRTDRLAQGEYTLCLCAADWCNVALPPAAPPPSLLPPLLLVLMHMHLHT